MLGTIVNMAAIIVGALLGKGVGKLLKADLQQYIMQAIGLGVLLVGFKMALGTENIIVVVISLMLGVIVGELAGIEDRLAGMGAKLEGFFANGAGEGTFVKGFVSASLLYCVGAMAIMGSLESGLTGNHIILYTKSLLDGATAIILASSLGLGVAFSALAVFVYQGSLTLLAKWIGVYLTEPVIVEMSAVGGLLIFAIGLDMLGIKKLRVGNLLPAIFVALFVMLFFDQLGIKI
ncbi:MAG: DUF554 domain-containing protein [Bacillota bacterium]